MAYEHKRKLIHYRRATFFQPISSSLQELVEDALSKLSTVSDRFERLDDGTDDDWQRFINMHKSALGMEFGNLVLYAPNQIKHTITIDHEASELDIENIVLSSSDGKKRQFLESILFYGIYKNNVIVLQSMALKSRDLEGYLTWLLRSAGVISKENSVLLNNVASTDTQDRLDKTDVKSVRIGTSLIDITNNDASERNPSRVKPKGEGMDILRILASDRVNDLSWADIQGAKDLEVFIEVKYKRQTDETTQKALNKITSVLRHVSDEDIRIELKDGGSVIGTDLKVKTYISVEFNDGVINPKDLFEKMQTWLLDILDQGIIDAE